MVVADLVVKLEEGNVEDKKVKNENGDIVSIQDEHKQPFNVGWSDDEEDKKDDRSLTSDLSSDDDDTKDVVKAELADDSTVPSKSPRSPSKAEEVESDQNRSSSSRQESLHADTPRNGIKKLGTGPTQSAKHLPRGEQKALKTFEKLKGNIYQNAKVGRSRGHEKEAMVCDCRYRPGIDDGTMACTDDCINRLTQVECIKSECHCGQYCQNQRFERGQYADVEIIETDKKGFGLRAGDNLPADRFIYEYIGEVVEQKEFLKRMEEYRIEGIRHFYFMMLQREEFLDATRKGGIARFVNHSCNPNCYVSKWHVGKYMRMGIFAKRDIERGEELTFNYNVDRYGNDAQPCYCGEPNCVGSIGGKTQTDIGGMEQLFIDALGIADQVDQQEAKGTRKKKSRHLDEDFTPILRPIDEESEIAKVITAVRQATSNRNILQKLLSRIHMTQDTKVQRSLVRLHGFVLMAGVIEEWKDDKDVVLLAMGSLARWPLLSKNKVVDSGVDRLVQDLAKQDDPEVSSLAGDLLKAWNTLEMSYRIARKEVTAAGNSASPSIKAAETDKTSRETPRRPLEAQAPNAVSNRLRVVAPAPRPFIKKAAPRSHYHDVDPHMPVYQASPSTPITPDEPRESPASAAIKSGPYFSAPLMARPVKKARIEPPVMSIEEIIRRANESEALQRKLAEEAGEAAKAEAERKAKAEEAARNKRIAIAPKGSHHQEQSPNHDFEEPNLEEADRRLKKLVGDIVVRYMSHYRDELDRDTFKKYARELTHIICDKEKRSNKSWPPSDNLSDGLSKDKTKKIKEFALNYIKKLVERKGKGKAKGSQEKASNDVSSIFVPVTPPRPESQSNDGMMQQLDRNEVDDTSMHDQNQTSLDCSNTPLSHTTTTAKGSDRTETSLDEERPSINHDKQG
jgi:hypothetical protein